MECLLKDVHCGEILIEKGFIDYFIWFLIQKLRLLVVVLDRRLQPGEGALLED